MRWTAVVNPGAGRRRRADDHDRLRGALADRSVDLHLTASARDGRAVAADAFARGDGVVVCGGDGTVREIAEVAATDDGLIAVVPSGAGNDFARALGLDHRDALAALSVLDTGEETRVDLGRVTTADGHRTVFTTVAHSGLDGEVNRWANTVTRLSGTALYAVAAIRTIATYRPTPMEITVDDHGWSGSAWLVAVANTNCYGGGMRIAPSARIDDGMLDVVVVHDVSRLRVLASLPRMMRGSHLAISGVELWRGRTVKIAGPDQQAVYASGERVGPLPATIELLAGALRVMTPTARSRPRP